MAWWVKVSLRRGGTGGLSATITIPRELYHSVGEPSEVMISVTGTGDIIVRPVKPVEVYEASWDEVERELESLKSARRETPKLSCVDVNDHVERQAACHGAPERVLVLCSENLAFIEYGDGLVEEIRGAYSCGYPGTSPGALARLIAWLAGRRYAVDPEAEKAEEAVKRSGVGAVLVHNTRRKVEVGVARR